MVRAIQVCLGGQRLAKPLLKEEFRPKDVFPIKAKLEQVLHMFGGNGENSYASNSKLQEKAIHRTRTHVEGAIKEVYKMVLPSKMVMADLGCSSGPNALLAVTEAIHIIVDQCRKLQREPPEIQVFLNDLPSNDFNSIFQSLDDYEHKLATELWENHKSPPPPHYISAIPGSFYGRLFPRRSVHFFHSSSCLMWISQVPQELENGQNDPSLMNKGNIQIWRTTPPGVVKAYQRQYRADLSTFLRARHAELTVGGRMVLTFVGRTNHNPAYGELSLAYRLLSEAMADMVSEGILSEEKLDSLNLPYYTPSLEEVHEIILEQGNDFFHLERFEIFQLNLDPFDDDDVNDVEALCNNIARSGKNAANTIRAALEPLIKQHLGIEEDDESMLDDLFLRYSKIIARQFLSEKIKLPFFTLVLKAL